MQICYEIVEIKSSAPVRAHSVRAQAKKKNGVLHAACLQLKTVNQTFETPLKFLMCTFWQSEPELTGNRTAVLSTALEPASSPLDVGLFSSLNYSGSSVI